MHLDKAENSRYLFLDTARHLLLCHQLHVLMLVCLCHLRERVKKKKAGPKLSYHHDNMECKRLDN